MQAQTPTLGREFVGQRGGGGGCLGFGDLGFRVCWGLAIRILGLGFRGGGCVVSFTKHEGFRVKGEWGV